MKNSIVLFLACLFCAHCTHTPKKFGSIVEIDIMANMSKNQKINLSTVASNIEYCVLETDEKCFVGGGMVTYCSQDYVVSLGPQAMNQSVCYVFDRKTGAFIRQISSQGRGPNEYEHVNPLFWDDINEQICVVAKMQYVFYNLDGTISHKTDFFRPGTSVFVAHDDYYVRYVPNPFGNSTIRIAFFDRTGTLIHSIPEHRSWKRTIFNGYNPIPLDGWVYAFHNDLYYKDISCDTLYHIKDFKLQPRYIFNTGGRTFPYGEQEGGRYSDLISWGSTDIIDRYERYVVINKIFEDNERLYFTFDYKRQRYPAVYDKTKDKLQIMPPVSNPPSNRGRNLQHYGFENDLDGGLPFWPQQMISDKEMMCVYTAEELLKLDKSKITDTKLRNVLDRIDEYSNPVVAIVTLR